MSLRRRYYRKSETNKNRETGKREFPFRVFPRFCLFRPHSFYLRQWRRVGSATTREGVSRVIPALPHDYRHRILKAEPQPEAELTIWRVGVFVGSADLPECAARKAPLRVIEDRRVGEVKRLGSELEVEALRDLETAEETEVPGRDPGAAQDTPAGGAKAVGIVGYGPESGRVEILLPGADAAENVNLAFHQIRSLVARPIHVQRRARVRDAERCAALDANDVVELPPSGDGREDAPATEPLLPLAERQFNQVGELEAVRAIKPTQRPVQVEELRDFDPRFVVAVVGATHPDGLRPGVVRRNLISLRELARQPRLQ